jgi:anti-anti-sigma regulatory factor
MAKKRAGPSATKSRKSAGKAEIPAQPVIVLEGSLDISGAGYLREQLLQVLAGKQSVTVDAANVERVDTAALQVLTAFFKDAVAQNMVVQWQEPSQALRDAARLLGLNNTLNIN